MEISLIVKGEEQVRRALDGNPRRFTGDHNIDRAMLDAANVMASTRSAQTEAAA